MLKFRGFRASIDLATGKGSGIEHLDTSPGISITGAYRSNKDEIYSPVFKYTDSTKKHNAISPSMVKLPFTETKSVKPAKSVNDLTTPNAPDNLRKSTSDIPQTVNSNSVQLTKNQIKEQKKLEKQRLADEKKREKAAAREQQKQDKIKKERDKKEQQAKLAQEKRDAKKRSAPKPKTERKPLRAAPQPRPQNEVPQNVSQSQVAPPRSKLKSGQTKFEPKPIPDPNPQAAPVYSTNTLESSISKSSGPPPYSAVPEVVRNQSDDTGNTSFAKPSDEGSWNLISQHRQQISRPTVSQSASKQKHLDLHYNVGSSKSGNSDV